MKELTDPIRWQLVAALTALLALSGCATSGHHTSTPVKRMTVRTTAYTHTEPGGSNNAIGSRLRFGGAGDYSAATDWSWLPLGTRFTIIESGRTYVVEDYGSALVGRQTVDLYVPSRREMRKWGVRHLDIQILKMGSKQLSLKLLAPRCRSKHVRVMVAQLRKQGITPG
jgi:3D (Asp-Asp-Asp) domain-containing protein